jgi:hypothetical protein
MAMLIFSSSMPESFFIGSSQAALPPGKYVIRDILAHDTNKHPETIAELWEMIDTLKNGKDVPGRTGWSGFKYVCLPDGTWEKSDDVRTSDSGRDKIYQVEEYRTEILAYLTGIHGSSMAQEIYQEVVNSGERLVYQEGSKTDSQTERNWIWYPCTPGQEGGYYNNADFYLTLTITVNSTPDPDPDPDPKPGDGNINAVADGPHQVASGMSYGVNGHQSTSSGKITEWQWWEYVNGQKKALSTFEYEGINTPDLYRYNNNTSAGPGGKEITYLLEIKDSNGRSDSDTHTVLILEDLGDFVKASLAFENDENAYSPKFPIKITRAQYEADEPITVSGWVTAESSTMSSTVGEFWYFADATLLDIQGMTPRNQDTDLDHDKFFRHKRIYKRNGAFSKDDAAIGMTFTFRPKSDPYIKAGLVLKSNSNEIWDYAVATKKVPLEFDFDTSEPPVEACQLYEIEPREIKIKVGQVAKYDGYFSDPCLGWEPDKVTTETGTTWSSDESIGKNLSGEGKKGQFLGVKVGETIIESTFETDQGILVAEPAKLIVEEGEPDPVDKDDMLYWNLISGSLSKDYFVFDSRNIPYDFMMNATVKGFMNVPPDVKMPTSYSGSYNVYDVLDTKDGRYENGTIAPGRSFEKSLNIQSTGEFTFSNDIEVLGRNYFGDELRDRLVLGENKSFVSIALSIGSNGVQNYVYDPAHPNLNGFKNRTGKYYLDTNDFIDRWNHSTRTTYYNSPSYTYLWIGQKQYFADYNIWKDKPYYVSNTDDTALWYLCNEREYNNSYGSYECVDPPAEGSNSSQLSLDSLIEVPAEVMVLPFTIYVEGTESELVVTPKERTVEVGETGEFTAEFITTTYKAGEEPKVTKIDVTDHVDSTWTSDKPSIASVHPTMKGGFIGNTPGSTPIKISYIHDREEYTGDGIVHVVREPLPLPDAGGVCSFDPNVPTRYEHELDLKVTRIDARTVDLNENTKTDVYVYRESFAQSRETAKAEFYEYIIKTEQSRVDCETLIQKWKAEKADLESQKSACESVEVEEGASPPDCSYFDEAIAEYESFIVEGENTLPIYDELIRKASDELDYIEKNESTFNKVTPTVNLKYDGSKVSEITVRLEEGQSLRATFPSWRVTAQGKGIVAQINENGPYEEFYYTDLTNRKAASLGYSTKYGHVLYSNSSSNNWKDTTQYVATYEGATCSYGDFFQDQTIEAIVRTVNDNGNKRNIKETLTSRFTKLPRNQMRAGYGFEYELSTIYKNHDTEPDPANATGTKKVESYFPTLVNYLPYTRGGAYPAFDLNGKPIPQNGVDEGYRVVMQTNQPSMPRNETKAWLLPPVAIEEFSGNVFDITNNDHINHPERNHSETLLTRDNNNNPLRRWYVDFTQPDGQYEFVVRSYDAGVNHLNTCHTGRVLVKGSIIGDPQGDDDYVKRSITPKNPFPSGIGWNWNGKENQLTSLAEWYFNWFKYPHQLPVENYEQTYYLTPNKMSEINEYYKDKSIYKVGESVLQEVDVPSSK